MPSNVSKPIPKAASPNPYRVIFGTFIHTPNLSELEICMKTLIGVNEDGVIEFIIKDWDWEKEDSLLLDEMIPLRANKNYVFYNYGLHGPKFFIPGFIDTHIHASQYPNIGIGLNTPLLSWLNDYTFPLESKFSTDLEMAKDVYSKVIKKTLSNGTTCGSYFTTIDPKSTNFFADLLLEHGQRGFVGKVCMDHNDTYKNYQESYETCVSSMNEIINHINEVNPKGERLVKPIVTPRFAPVCSRKMLTYLGKLCKEQNLPIQTHISENKDEIKLVKSIFPECENYAAVYDHFKLLNRKTILAHGIHLTEEEIGLIKKRKCSISHCPTSNTFISSGEAPIYKYLYEDQINVSLGTDVSGGFDSSILQIIKHSILVSHHKSMHENSNKKISIEDALYMATMGGAKAVGLDKLVGSFEVGKKFDAQLIDFQEGATDVFKWQLPSDITDSLDEQKKKIFDLLSKWVFSGDDRNCVKVWCNGRLVINKKEDKNSIKAHGGNAQE
ncbi:unnamed protein product [Candida verbasci]|uniref:Guanine deaminase n=1 Tax=Candida verbasci TaxID=1227364 RepID=A0A9W4XF94_9ASCO|nr:unnamed protein product [Candida verbasci]